jgi:hypothetical protein
MPPEIRVINAAFLGAIPALYEEFNIFPRLGFTSPLPECGKLRLSIYWNTSLRATRSDNLRTAVAFRIMEEYRPSLLLDELDTFIHENIEMIGATKKADLFTVWIK